MTEKPSPTQIKTWRLFLTASVKILDQIDSRLRAAKEIPLSWYDVLIELHEAPEKRMRISELADRVLLTRSGLTPLIDKMEKSGYLVREINPEDDSGFYAIITDSGIVAMHKAWTIYAAGIQELFSKYLSEDDAELFNDIFTKLLADMPET